MTGLVEWLKSGEYLPPRLRDFHDQKDVFKSMWRLIQNKRKEEPAYLQGMTCHDAHILVIDQFLWFMAAHGYTLQRSRIRGVDFCDLDAEVERTRNESTESLKSMFAAAKKTEIP